MATPRSSAAKPPLVSVIMIFLDEERFIGEAIDSVFAQTWLHWELLLVDDGSTDASTTIARRVASRHPETVRYLQHPRGENRGMSASRNLGLEHARGAYVTFLDGDDVYLPQKLERQVAAMEENGEAGMSFAATEYWHSWRGEGASSEADRDRVWSPSGVPVGRISRPPELLVAFLEDGNTLPCMGSVMVRREVAQAVGGFEAEFRSLFEDQAFLAKVSLATPVLPVPDCLDRYRQHDGSACATATPAQVQRARDTYRGWLEKYLRRTGAGVPAVYEALDRAQTTELPIRSNRTPPRSAVAGLRELASRYLERFKRWRRSPYPQPGLVRFGSLRRTTPISRIWGRDRGRSLDRYYIEGFLDEHRGDIRGRVLEVADAHYTRTLGGDRVVRSDVLHVDDSNPEATIIADLASADHVPSDMFDCIILTQTLQLIFDVPAALRTVHRLLKPGGVLLATFPGITHTGDADWHGHWCWSFTTTSARRLFDPVFGTEHVSIGSHGNVLAATAFLHGLADSELKPAELDHHDPAYDLVITVRAVRSGKEP